MHGVEVLKYAVSVLAGYLLGSVSVAVILCKLIKNEDVRGKGSKNAGATNVARVYGMGLGLLTLAGDAIKTVLAFLIGNLLLGESGAAVGMAACLIGHCWPVFFGFKGGKGVVVCGTIAAILDWRFLLVLIAVFALMFVLTRRVSVGSLTAAVVYTPTLILLGERAPLNIALGILAFVIVCGQHIPNIKRLANNTEGEFKPGKQG